MKITTPKDWTNDKEQMKMDFYWTYNDSEGQVLAKDYCLDVEK